MTVTGRKGRLATLAVLGAAGVCAAGPLTPVDSPVPDELELGEPLGLVAAERLAKTPVLKTDKPLPFTFVLGNDLDSLYSGLLDESGGPRTGYDTIYFDANNNNDLTDDPRIRVTVEAKTGGRGGRHLVSSFPPGMVLVGDSGERRVLKTAAIPVTVRYFDGTSRDLAVVLRAAGDSSGWRVGLAMAKHLEGTADFGSRRGVKVALYDRGGGNIPNGSFADLGVDEIGVDRDGNGTIEEGERSPLNAVLAVDGRFWQVRTDPAGSELTVEASPLPAYECSIRYAAPERARLVSAVAWAEGGPGMVFNLNLAGSGACSLPEGRYRLSGRAEFSPASGAGTNWFACFNLDRPFQVAAGRPVSVALGAPFRVEPSVRGTAARGRKVEVEFSLSGAAGEAYKRVGPVGEYRMEPPAVAILDPRGAAVENATMEYG